MINASRIVSSPAPEAPPGDPLDFLCRKEIERRQVWINSNPIGVRIQEEVHLPRRRARRRRFEEDDKLTTTSLVFEELVAGAIAESPLVKAVRAEIRCTQDRAYLLAKKLTILQKLDVTALKAMKRFQKMVRRWSKAKFGLIDLTNEITYQARQTVEQQKREPVAKTEEVITKPRRSRPVSLIQCQHWLDNLLSLTSRKQEEQVSNRRRGEEKRKEKQKQARRAWLAQHILRGRASGTIVPLRDLYFDLELADEEYRAAKKTVLEARHPKGKPPGPRKKVRRTPKWRLKINAWTEETKRRKEESKKGKKKEKR